VRRAERSRIAHAIGEAERGTTGRIAVRIVPDADLDAFERAKEEFGRIGLHRHPHANAAVILVAPKARRYAIVGDRALHERVGDAFWNGLVEDTGAYLKRGEVDEGIIYAVGRLGDVFRANFAEPAK